MDPRRAALSHPHLAPLAVGTLAILAFAVYLTSEMPGPGPLAAAHAAIDDAERLPGCGLCHAEDGLASGCLSCHGEISRQLREGRGYHARVVDAGEPDCAACHPDHEGGEFDLLGEIAWRGEGPEGFDHSHVEFNLTGKHEGLECAKCHNRPFVLPGFEDHVRARTYLGLAQECISCHENIHKEERFRGCGGCHDQQGFKGATSFTHDKLPLLNGHRGVACGKCHLLDSAVAPHDYGGVRGKRCEECHDDPHRVEWGRDCESCHPRDATPWSVAAAQVDPALHLRAGFPLSAPHDKPGCARCHAEGRPYAERFPSPPRPPNSCASCHEDIHRGQFAGKGCLDCHSPDRWKPSLLTVADHRTFPLRLAHAKAACGSCHKEGLFRGAPRACAQCHEDIHRGQFGARTCDACHSEAAFKPALYTAKEHRTFPLRAAHARAECAKCHRPEPGTGVARFAGTPKACGQCHEDRHRGQFGARDCDACHTEKGFLPSRIDIASHGTFPLAGSHRAVSCRGCHAEGRFAGAPRSCRECHADPHGGQFAAEVRKGDCTACHAADASTFAIRPYDHAARTGHPLEGAHAKAACSRCHAERAVKGAPAPVRQYRGAPRECAACHTDVHRGQFAGKRCDVCHLDGFEWSAGGLDHSRTRFPLDRAHRGVACDRCHPTVRQPDGGTVVQYRPVSTECQSCHAFKQK